MPLAGDYHIAFGARAYNANAVGGIDVQVHIGGVAVGMPTQLVAGHGGNEITLFAEHAAKTFRVTGVAAGATAEHRYKASTGTGTFSARWLRLYPVELG